MDYPSLIFQESRWLYALCVIPPLLGMFYAAIIWKKKRLAAFGEEPLIKRITPTNSTFKIYFKPVLAAGGLACIFLQLASPAWLSQKEISHPTDVFFVLDESLSMLATDVSPSRMNMAKRFLHLLVAKLPESRIGLITFAGTAVLQSPLTLDSQRTNQLITAIDPAAFSYQGTAIAEGVEKALASFPKKKKVSQNLVLVTDGEDHENNAVKTAAMAQGLGVTLWVVGVGTASGSTIPLRSHPLVVKKDKKGATVITRMNLPLLDSLSVISVKKDSYRSNSDVEAQANATAIAKSIQQRSVNKIATIVSAVHPYFLYLALVFLLIEFILFERKGIWLGQAILVLMVVGTANPVIAQHRHDVARDYNLGEKLYAENNFSAAAKTFLAVASSAKDTRLRANAWYNAGNSFFKLKNYPGSIQAYLACLAISRNDSDARYNLAYARRMNQPKAPPPPMSTRPENPRQVDEMNKDKAHPVVGPIGRSDKDW